MLEINLELLIGFHFKQFSSVWNEPTTVCCGLIRKGAEARLRYWRAYLIAELPLKTTTLKRNNGGFHYFPAITTQNQLQPVTSAVAEENSRWKDWNLLFSVDLKKLLCY